MAVRVDERHPEYVTWAPRWRRVRDAVEGQDAIKKGGVLYLPMLSGWSKDPDGAEKYASYLARAVWYDATDRTRVGGVGVVGRRPPTVEGIPERLLRPQEQRSPAEALLFKGATKENIDNAGTPLDVFALGLVDEVLQVGRVGLQVDVPPDDDKEAPKVPYLVMWKCEQIIMWREQTVAGRPQLTYVVLEYELQEPGEGGKGLVCRKQWRELELVRGGSYVQRIYDPDGTGEHAAEKPSRVIEPKRRTATLNFLPFVIIGPRRLGGCIDKPPLLPVADMNIAHFRNSADLEHGRHACGMATPWVATSGAQLPSPLPLGPTEVIKLNQGDTLAFAEPSGSGLQHLASGMEEKERKMAMLGARLLQEEKRAAETAEALRLRQAGESATLATVARTVSSGVRQALQWWLWWNFEPSADLKFELNQEFSEGGLAASDAIALMQLWQQGGISQETFMYLLHKGELLPPGKTVEQELEDIADEEPPRMPARPGDANQDPDAQEDPADDQPGNPPSPQQQQRQPGGRRQAAPREAQ
jgi:hypothetical protein